jgi:uncharacterized protein YegL
MTDSEYTHLALIVDRSGSMQRIVTDMNGAIEHLVKDQEDVPGRISIDVTTFDDTVEFIGRDLTVQGVLELAPLVVPRGMTALYDAIGKTVVSLGEHLAKMDEVGRPGKVLVAIVTDGLENSSKDWDLPAVNKAITTQRETYGWEFVFLGANMDAVHVAAGMGIPRGSSITYAPSSAGVTSTMHSLAGATRAYRGPGGQSISFTEDERAEAMGDDA